MKIIDVTRPDRLNKKPDKSITLLSSGNFFQHGFQIKQVLLKQYIEKSDEKQGDFSLITAFVDTDKGSVEMKYDEGYLGKNVLDRQAKFLTSNVGLSGLILRSVIALKEENKNK